MQHKNDVTYIEAKDWKRGRWWCIHHKRWATHLRIRYGIVMPMPERVCDPSLGGIMLPCQVVDVSDIVEAIKKELRDAEHRPDA